MRAEWWGAIFGAAIFIRMVLCAVCMTGRTDHFVRIAMLGTLAASLGLMAAPFYAELDVPVELLLAGSVAAYLYADRRTVGACGMTCPHEVGVVLDWLDRWRRPLASALIVGAVVGIFSTAHATPARTAEAAPPDYVWVKRADLEQVVALTNWLIAYVNQDRGAGCP